MKTVFTGPDDSGWARSRPLLFVYVRRQSGGVGDSQTSQRVVTAPGRLRLMRRDFLLIFNQWFRRDAAERVSGLSLFSAETSIQYI